MKSNLQDHLTWFLWIPSPSGALWRRTVLASLRCLAMVCLLATTGSLLKADSLQQKGDLFLTRSSETRTAVGSSRVIIRLRGDLTPPENAHLRFLGVTVYQNLPLIHSVAACVPCRNLSRLAALPFVTHLSSDALLQKCDEFIVGSSGADTAYTQYHLTGSGIGVAVLDTGVAPHMDLNNGKVSRVVANINCVPNSNTAAASDLCGHGTHVAGIIAGNGAGSTGSSYFRTFYGIARGASIINVRVLDTFGQGSVSNMISAIAWCIINRKRYNIRVMNLSLGHPVGEHYTTDPLCQAVELAWKAGIVVVCAAGNNGRLNASQTAGLDNEGWGTAYGSIQSPGNDPYVITVGAMKNYSGTRAYNSSTDRPGDCIATYSSRGPSRLDLTLKPDIVAPGNCVISLNALQTYLPNTYGSTNFVIWNEFSSVYKSMDSSKYFRLSGTSMAAPVVSGAAALMLQNDPALSPDTVKARLMLSADKWSFPDGTSDPCTFGAGYLNIPAALRCTAVAGQYALSPAIGADINGDIAIEQNLIWGAKAVWGTGITDLKAIWGTGSLLGTNVLSSSKAIWGSGVLSDTAVSSIGTGGADLSIRAVYGE